MKKHVKLRSKQPIISAIFITIGYFASLYLTYKAATQIETIKKEQKEKYVEAESDEERKEITKETAKMIAKKVAPIVVIGGATIGVTFYTAVMTQKKMDTLMLSLLGSNCAYNQLTDKTKQAVGDEKTKEIISETAKERCANVYGLSLNGFAQARGGSIPFYDICTGRAFLSDVNTITQVADKLHHRLRSGAEASIVYNEFYQDMDLSLCKFAEIYGWGGMTGPNEIIPNLNNTFKLGEQPVIILDWYYRPTVIM